MFKGVARELGRSKCLLVIRTRRRAPTNEQVNAPALERVVLSLLVSENKGADEVSGEDSEEEQARDGHLEVLADHSTEGSK